MAESEPLTSADGDTDPVEVIDLTGLSDSSSDTEDDHGRHELEANAADEDDDRSSSASGFEITLDDATRARLYDAISTVNAERLRRIVHTLATTVPAAEAVLFQELITLKRKTRDEGEDGDPDANADISRNGTMIVVPRWETCCNCDEEFDVAEEREEAECISHPGELECDYDAEGWADWDESCHGPFDTSANRKSYPENFRWTCCDASGDGPGCLRGKHRAAIIRKKRRIYS